MKRIIIDTNFLLIPYQFKVDIFAEIGRVCLFPHELCIMEKTVDELEHIKKGQSLNQKKAANYALALIKTVKLRRLPSTRGVDRDIITIADTNTIVATQDLGLKRKLKGKDCQFLVLRKKSYLALL